MTPNPIADTAPVSLSPPLATGALLAAVCINNAAQLPSEQVVQTLLWLALVATIITCAFALACRQLRRHLYHHPALRPRRRRTLEALTLAKNLLLRGSAGALSAWLLLTLACNDARQWLHSTLAPACEGLPLVLTLQIDDVPTVIDGQGRVAATLPPAQTNDCGQLPRRLSLGWNADPDDKQYTGWSPQPGEQWRVNLTLKRPIATLNFDGFDVHHYWLREGIGAIGRLTPPPRAQRPIRIDDRGTDTPLSLSHRISRYRQMLAHRIANALPETAYPHQSILLGLAIGLQKSISPSQWTVLSATGTSHLVSISGMHVTLLAGWLAWVVMQLWPRMPALALRIPTRNAAALISVPVSALYAALAGWGVPAQRTVASLALACCMLLLQQRARPLDLLCLAATLVACTNPWSATSAGFLLSFGAVGILIFSGTGRTQHAAPQFPRLQKLTHEHIIVFIGLMPLSIALFGQYSWVSPIANLLAVGWMGLLTTPLILAACLLDIPLLMQAAHASLTPIWWMLEQLTSLSLAWQPVAAPPLTITVLSIAGGFLALMPSGLMLRTPGLLLIALPFIWPTDKPAHGEFELTVLDIGQGNSIAVRTRSHTLLVDAGNATSPRNDQGRMTVLPWLYHRGQRHWDAVLVSHNDSDHAGGIGSVLRTTRTGALYANPPFQPLPPDVAQIAQTRPCTAGTHWTWDDVRFDILYPSEADLATETEDNAISCVLRISSRHGSALLPADIGIEQETKLIERLGADAIRADVVLVPHHGSDTSSSPDFIKATGARWAVFQVGYRNRYGHPKASISQTWQQHGADNLRTDHAGALRFSFTSQGIHMESARNTGQRFWHLPPESALIRPLKKRSHRSGATTSSDSLSE